MFILHIDCFDPDCNQENEGLKVLGEHKIAVVKGLLQILTTNQAPSKFKNSIITLVFSVKLFYNCAYGILKGNL
jgi:hypothetical protein